MSVKNQLKRSLYQVVAHDNSGSYATRSDRSAILTYFINDLILLNYKIPEIKNLKQKHIIAVVNHWQQSGLSSATLKNRVSILRHLAALINKTPIVPSNQELKIAPRRYVAVTNRALYNPDFSGVNNVNLKVSLELQRVFGLRREESLKIRPHLADKQDKLELLPSWCKGGRGRTLPIRTEEQRYWLERAKEVAGKLGNSLVPEDKNYIKQRYIYDKQATRAGLYNLHGLRHAYAQQRYKELTGWEAPINGGPTKKELTKEQKKQDRLARMILTEELGHSRIQIVSVYIS